MICQACSSRRLTATEAFSAFWTKSYYYNITVGLKIEKKMYEKKYML